MPLDEIATLKARITELETLDVYRVRDMDVLRERISELEQASEARGQEVDEWRKRCQAMGIRMFEADKALNSIALNHAEAARSGVTKAMNALDGKFATPATTPGPACDCIPCRCEHETQCQGCGAKMCDRRKAATPAVEHPDTDRLNKVEDAGLVIRQGGKWRVAGEVTLHETLRGAIDAARSAE